MSLGIDSKYRIELVDPSGLVVADITGLANNRKLTFVRNGTYEAEFIINLDSLEQVGRAAGVSPRSMLATGRNDCRIYRLGGLLFAGRVMYDGSSFGENVEESVKVDGWFNLLKDRRTSISRSFSSVDAG